MAAKIALKGKIIADQNGRLKSCTITIKKNQEIWKRFGEDIEFETSHLKSRPFRT